MNLQEAIEILAILEARSINNSTMFKKDALKLGIEALKHYQESSAFACGCLLPGQTVETKD